MRIFAANGERNAGWRIRRALLAMYTTAAGKGRVRKVATVPAKSQAVVYDQLITQIARVAKAKKLFVINGTLWQV